MYVSLHLVMIQQKACMQFSVLNVIYIILYISNAFRITK